MNVMYKIYDQWHISVNLKEEKFDNLKKNLTDKGIQFKVLKKVPSMKSLYRWLDDGVCPTPDGCRVEPDGDCSHGLPSWIKLFGYI